MINQDVAKILYEIGEYLEMQEVPFKPRAYQKAADAIANLEEDLKKVYEEGGRKALLQIPGIGQGISERIEEFIKTGKIVFHEELKKQTPINLEELTRVEGLGPRSAKVLYQKLGVATIADLKKAAKSGKIRELPGFGKRSEENILKSLEFIDRSGSRELLGYIEPEVRRIEEGLKKLKWVDRVEVAGSFRRRKETVGDVDFLVASDEPEKVMEHFVGLPQVKRIIAHGATKSSVKILSGLNMDLRVVPKGSFGAALNYFTGSKDHNVALRQIAIRKGMKLNEYGLFSVKTGKQIVGATEEEIYRTLGLQYIEPEMRENTGEIELAEKGELPKLIGYADMKGDLQVHSDWTDGKNSIEEMAIAAYEAGLEYIAITDHTKNLAMVGGLNEKDVLKQMAEIDSVNKKLSGKIRVLKGVECDILKSGSLDLSDEVLKKLDVVGVSIHSYFNLSRSEQTERIIKAISNPNVDILLHPTARLINKREACQMDIEKVIETAKATGTVLEVDAFPDRLDLKDEYIRRSISSGVKIAIDTDAHTPGNFQFMKYGIAQARRGFAEKKDVINAWPAEKMLGMLKKSHDKPSQKTQTGRRQ